MTTHEQAIAELTYHRQEIQTKQDQMDSLQIELAYHHDQLTVWAGLLALVKS